jgi:hypothetical protein
MQKNLKDAANGKSELVPYVHSDHAWTPDQKASSNTDDYHDETLNPTGYQNLSQNKDAANGKSEWTEYVNGSDAWTEAMNSNSHEQEWKDETAKPAGYQKMLEDSKFHSKPIKGWTSLMQKKSLDAANGKSEWTEYVNGSDAWTSEHKANSHEQEYTAETANPTGYQKMLEDSKYHSKPIKGWTGSLAQKKKLDAANGKSEWTDYEQGSDAWTSE